MPRKREIVKRVILPDPKYRSEILAKFINCVMKSGKKSVAEKIVYGALDRIEERIKKGQVRADEIESDVTEGLLAIKKEHPASLKVFINALNKIRPTVEVRSRRVGGATYQVPVEVRLDRGIALAMRWLIESARERSEKGMMMQLSGEVTDALEGRGTSLKKREDMHRMAKANQAFAHFRWT